VVLAARFTDRLGKGMRGAPRDALVADVTPAAIRGRAFGLRQAMDTVGAFVGPLLAIALMLAFHDDMRRVFAVAVIPGAVAVLLVLTLVRDQGTDPAAAGRPPPLRLHDLRELDRRYWWVAAIGGLFTLARFSEAFLILKASDEGLPLALAPLVLVAMNIVYSLGAYPAGAISDRLSQRTMLLLGLVPLIAADLLLALTSGLGGAFAGICLWGAHMALTQGLMAKLVADRAPLRLRGSAFGIFNLVVGIALLAGNLAAGLLWSAGGPHATFLVGAALAGTAFLLLAIPVRTTAAARSASSPRP
jgi:MFS family permease